MEFSYRQGAYSKARAYTAYCEENDYTLFISYREGVYTVVTGGGVEFFDSLKDLVMWLAQRYDDEVDAGNIKLPYEPAKVEVFYGSEN